MSAMLAQEVRKRGQLRRLSEFDYVNTVGGIDRGWRLV